MIYVLAVFLPPLGLLLNGQPFSAIFNLVLIVFCFIFGWIFPVLFAVPSLALIAADASLADGLYIAVLDALRGDVFAGAYLREGDEVTELAPVKLVPQSALAHEAAQLHATIVGPEEHPRTIPRAANVVRLGAWLALEPVSLAAWEPDYGRLAEAQVKWEQAHGRPLPVA